MDANTLIRLADAMYPQLADLDDGFRPETVAEQVLFDRLKSIRSVLLNAGLELTPGGFALSDALLATLKGN